MYYKNTVKPVSLPLCFPLRPVKHTVEIHRHVDHLYHSPLPVLDVVDWRSRCIACAVALGFGAYWVGNPFITMDQLQYPSKARQMKDCGSYDPVQ